eukprot:scaffold139_cov246-Pinguiococcus_pyrenoidosus.AAC.11
MNTRRSPWRRLNQNPHMTRTPRPRRKAESTVAWEPTAFNGMLTGYHDTRAGAARRAQLEQREDFRTTCQSKTGQDVACCRAVGEPRLCWKQEQEP